MAMTATELCELVGEMRRAQEGCRRLGRDLKHLRSRPNADQVDRMRRRIEESRRLEREVDAAIEQILRQPTLFT